MAGFQAQKTVRAVRPGLGLLPRSWSPVTSQPQTGSRVEGGCSWKLEPRERQGELRAKGTKSEAWGGVVGCWGNRCIQCRALGC